MGTNSSSGEQVNWLYSGNYSGRFLLIRETSQPFIPAGPASFMPPGHISITPGAVQSFEVHCAFTPRSFKGI